MPRTNRQFDIAIIGGGVSCTHLLHAILRGAKGSRAGLRIAVIEKEGEFWRGFPYGRRSSINSLIITPLSEFVPACERDDFVRWLQDNLESWQDTLADEGGEVGKHWLHTNAAAIASGAWDEIYVPRRLYGDFIAERTDDEVARASSRMDATVDKITACVEHVERSASGFVLHSSAHAASMTARTIVLAIGSPPSLRLSGSEDLSDKRLYVNNAYLPSLDENLQSLKHTLQASPAGGRNVLVVGSNATSLELIYMISRRQDLLHCIDKLVVLSRSGAFPHRMTRDRFKKQAFPRIQSLQAATHVAGPDILDATNADLQDLADAGLPIGDCLDHLNKLLVTLLDKMEPRAEQEFHARYGMEFTRLVRRAGAEYRDPVDELASAGKLDVIRASFQRLTPYGDGVHVTYEIDGAAITSPLSFGAVFNCAGFENVGAESSSPLLGSLVRTELVSANETGRGLKVDDRFSAGPNLFVCGPLLAGVFNEKAKFWHVENVRRIQSIAEMMGPAILSVQLREA